MPRYLSVPSGDLFAAGKPLLYRVVDGWPKVWSVGPNRMFDEFTAPTDDTPGATAGSGDWRLLPPGEVQY